MSYLNVSCDGKVATVFIDRHEKGNSLNPDLLKEIYSTFSKLSTDNKINVVILTGGEKYFSAGFDLNEIKKIKLEKNNEYIELFHKAYKSILFCSLPVIAAIGGPAIAGGFDISMMCDFRYASKKAKFGQREIPLSLTPILDPLWRIIGYSRALEVSFTGRIYDVQEAYAMGFVSKIFETGELLENVNKIAAEISTYDRKLLVETKQLGQQLLNSNLNDSMKIQEWLFRTFMGSEDNHERIDKLQNFLKNQKK